MRRSPDCEEEFPLCSHLYSGVLNQSLFCREKNSFSFEQTTANLVIQLRSVKLTGQEYDQLSQVLTLSDFVKFAKYNPEQEDNENSFKVIRDSIREIEELKKAQAPVIEKTGK